MQLEALGTLDKLFIICSLVVFVSPQGVDQGDRTAVYGNKLPGHTSLPSVQPPRFTIYIDASWRLDPGYLQTVYVFANTIDKSTSSIKFQIWTKSVYSRWKYRLKWEKQLNFEKGERRLYEFPIQEIVELDEDDKIGHASGPGGEDPITWTFKSGHETMYSTEYGTDDVTVKHVDSDFGIMHSIAVHIRRYYEGDVRLAVTQRTPFLEGTVEVFYGERWGTVCGDSWGTDAAYFICAHHFGYVRAQPIEGALITPSTIQPVIKYVSCLNARCLQECSVTPIQNIPGRRCYQSHAAGVRCMPWKPYVLNHISAGRCQNTTTTTTTTTTFALYNTTLSTTPVNKMVSSGPLTTVIIGTTVGCISAAVAAVSLIFVLNHVAKRIKQRRTSQRRRQALDNVYRVQVGDQSTMTPVVTPDGIQQDNIDHSYRGAMPSPPPYSAVATVGVSHPPPSYDGSARTERSPPPYLEEPPPPYRVSMDEEHTETSV